MYPTGFDGINWCVFSCFDEEAWRDIKIPENQINIGLYHGAIRGSLTDSDWQRVTPCYTVLQCVTAVLQPTQEGWNLCIKMAGTYV